MGESQSQYEYLNERLREVEAQRDELLANDVAVWLDRMQHTAIPLRNYQSSLSWRVTAPLRAVRTFQLSAGRIGFGATVSLTWGYLRRRVGKR